MPLLGVVGGQRASERRKEKNELRTKFLCRCVGGTLTETSHILGQRSCNTHTESVIVHTVERQES